MSMVLKDLGFLSKELLAPNRHLFRLHAPSTSERADIRLCKGNDAVVVRRLSSSYIFYKGFKPCAICVFCLFVVYNSFLFSQKNKKHQSS